MEEAVGTEVRPSQTAAIGCASKGSNTLLTATLHRSASREAAYAIAYVLHVVLALVGSKRHEARTVAQAAVLASGAVETAVGIEVGPWRTAEVVGGSEDPYTIPSAALHLSASSAAACANVHASCRFDPTILYVYNYG
ncbi:hypothetical protein RB195_015339 [Necator americanus]|uniref:Uncharacterized protein n=1 Tax=Necator americanus TaxID=51031 RepID=A0ABR1E5X2_NECAM